MQGSFQYLIIGNGRVARHMKHYLALLNLPALHWHRQYSLDDLHVKLTHSTHVLLLINDDAIVDFHQQYLANDNHLCLHFSGSLLCTSIIGAHPLMTFAHELYSLATYQSIPFILDEKAPEFACILPGLNNPHARIKAAQKAKYHALCVMAGNFSCLLWQKLFKTLENEFNINANYAKPYLTQITENLLKNPDSILTGPLVRGDKKTIQRNLQALKADPFHLIYDSFVACYQTLERSENDEHL